MIPSRARDEGKDLPNSDYFPLVKFVPSSLTVPFSLTAMRRRRGKLYLLPPPFCHGCVSCRYSGKGMKTKKQRTKEEDVTGRI